MRDGKERVSKLKQRKQASVLLVFIVTVALCTLYIAADYCNFPSKIEFDIKKINMDVFGIVMNIVIVVITFVLTYYFVEKRRIEKLDNQRSIAIYLMKQCYESCLYYADMIEEMSTDSQNNRELNEREEREQRRLCDFFSEQPFKEEDSIRQYMVEGILSEIDLEHYFTVKKKYETYVFMNIMTNCSKETSVLLNELLKKRIRLELDDYSKTKEDREMSRIGIIFAKLKISVLEPVTDYWKSLLHVKQK